LGGLVFILTPVRRPALDMCFVSPPHYSFSSINCASLYFNTVKPGYKGTGYKGYLVRRVQTQVQIFLGVFFYIFKGNLAIRVTLTFQRPKTLIYALLLAEID
jgi:hypothetical protein